MHAEKPDKLRSSPHGKTPPSAEHSDWSYKGRCSHLETVQLENVDLIMPFVLTLLLEFVFISPVHIFIVASALKKPKMSYTFVYQIAQL